MSLMTCKECGSSVSSKADKCPNCGNPIKKKHSCLAVGCFTMILIIAISIGITEFDKASDKTNPRQKKIESLFSAWDGSNYELTKTIKKTMNDPNSFEHVETTYLDKGDHLVVKTTFRGKNAFGGVVENWVMAKVNLDGYVIEIILQGP